MATVPSVPSFASGNVDVASKLTSLAQGLQLFLTPPYCDAINSAGIACTSGTATLITLDTENEDTDGMHSTSTNTSRIALNTAGLYEIHAFCRFPSNSTGMRTLNVRANSAGSSSGGATLTTINVPAVNGGTTFVERTFNYRPTSPGTDYVEMFVTQNSGGSLTTDGGTRVTGMQVRWISS